MSETQLLSIFKELAGDKLFFSRLDANESYSDSNSCWAQICRNLLGFYDNMTALEIKTRYEKDLEGLKTKIKRIFNQTKKFIFKVKNSELKSFATISVRKKLSAQFTHLLTQKLQNNANLPCHLQCNNNWIAAGYESWKGISIKLSKYSQKKENKKIYRD